MNWYKRVHKKVTKVNFDYTLTLKCINATAYIFLVDC